MIRSDAVTLRQLRMLAAVAETGSLTGAARQMGLTVSAVHAQIGALENALGAVLLDRGAGFAPSPEGRAMLAAARQAEAALTRAVDEIAALQRGESGRVTLGVVSTGKYFAPHLVRAVMDEVPRAEITLRVGNREATIDGLASGALDVAVMGRPPRSPEVEAVALGPHPHGVLLPPGHRLAGRRSISGLDLAREVFLAREPGSGTRILMARWLDRASEGHEVRTIEMDSNETIKQAVIAGLGIAFLSLHTAAEELRSGRLALLLVPGLPIERTWYLCRPLSREPTALTRRVAETIAARARALMPVIPGAE